MPIHDIGYRPYQGPRRLGGLDRVIARRAVRAALRGKLIRALLIAGAFSSVGCGVALYFATRVSGLVGAAASAAVAAAAGEGSGLAALLRTAEIFHGFLKLQLGLATLVAMLAGGGLIAADLGPSPVQFYFTRPVRVVDYLRGKLLALAVPLLLCLVVPALLLVGLRLAFTASLRDAASVLPQCLAVLAGAAIGVVVLGLPAAACSSVFRRAAFGRALFLGLVIGSAIASGILREITREPAAKLLSLVGDVDLIAAALLGVGGKGDPRWLPVAAGLVLVFCAAASLAVMRGRVAQASAEVSRT